MSEILYEANPSMIRRNPLGTVAMMLAVPAAAVGAVMLRDNQSVAGALIAVAGIALLLLMYWWAQTKMDHLIIRDDEIVWTHGLLNKDVTEINMGSVRTTRVSQSLMQRIVNAGDVTIFTSGDIPELIVKGMPDPQAIRNFIKGEVPDRAKDEEA